VNPTRKKLAPDPLLRAAAEAQLAKAPQTDGRAATGLLHELQVHQIELEMQNEALRAKQSEIEESRDRYIDLYEFAPLGYLTLSLDGMIEELNLSAVTLLAQVRNELLQRRFTNLVVPEDQSRWAELFLRLKNGDDKDRVELSLQRGDGTVLPVRLEGEKRPGGNGAAQIRIALSDLTSYKAAEEQIHDLAYTDLLTGLANRRKLIIRMQQAISAGEDQQHSCALMMLDLDNFKNLNDSLGHEQGDVVLQGFAKRLSAAARDGDTVARLGADEFAVLLDPLSPDPQQALRQVESLASKMLAALEPPYQLAGSTISCSASIGITFFGEQHEEPLEPLKRAELAMYQAKSAGRNTLRFFEPQMQAAVDARVLLEEALHEAIQKQQFTLYYQAQVSDSEGIVGAEALLRWLDPRRGMVWPAEFITLAEETGLILPIGAWVLEAACQQLALWASQPAMAQLSIAVNVSARQFRESNFVEQVLATLQRTHANPQRLKLELTESVLVANAEEVIVKMNALKAMGIGFAIDDFGTGYSSLSYLKRLPLERLKIDQGFVRNILTDADDAAISRAVIAMATSMGLGVIAEGVETEAQREFLASLGCHTYQGYLFNRPLPPEKFEALAQRLGRGAAAP